MFNHGMSLFYPDQLWRLVPEAVDLWDTAIQKNLKNANDPFWRFVERLTDSPGGIAAVFIIFFGVWFFFGERSRARFLFGLRFVAIFLLLMAVSDFIAHKFFKIPIGRLKPRVNAIIPDFYQPLSFPSSHAFNMVFGWNLLRLYFKRCYSGDAPRRCLLFLSALIPLIFVVSWSRIALNEHYPLDIAFGWIFGGLVSWALFPIFLRCMRYFNNVFSTSERNQV